MQRVAMTMLNRSKGSNECLPNDLPTKNSRRTQLFAVTPKKILLYLF
jgi:hypothetical protein